MSLRTVLAMPTIIACSLSLCACTAFADRPKVEKELDLTVAFVEAQALRVEARNGGISIASSETDEVQIHARIHGSDRERVEAAVVRTEREKSGELHIWAEWPTERKSNEGVSFSIMIPATSGIFAESSNGSISITDLAGPYDLNTSNGPIQIMRAIGDVRADTSNGAITINGTPGKVYADTSNGDISVSGVSGPIAADTSNGNIEVALIDTNPGPVDADTSNGSITIAVGPAFDGSMIADTSNGKVRFGPFPAGYRAEVTKAEKDLVRATFGPSSHRSRLDTSNGTITVRATAGG